MGRYHVFLSFRGTETRRNLVQYLYDKLTDLGVEVFLDSEEINYGENINNTIIKAIQRSHICVPIFSQDFASSHACLMEVAHMVESKKEIRPIFFFVEPDDVQNQQGTYEKSFAEHKNNGDYDKSTIEKWKDALKNIPEKRGLVFKKAALEAAVGGIKEQFFNDLFRGFRELEHFISKLWKHLNWDEQDVTQNLVGIDRYMPDMMRKLGFVYKDRQVIGEEKTRTVVLVVWGIAGVGKTTLAREVYSNIRHLFEGCSFLENVRYKTIHKDVEPLQNKLIRELSGGGHQEVKYSDQGIKKIRQCFRDKRVLIVLDDVENSEHIKPLADEVSWFGPGSIIILTSTRKDVDKHYKVSENIRREHHQVSCMNEIDALKLFNKHAITNLDHLPENYDDLSNKIISAVGYLPFTIEMVGNYLRGKSNEIWKEAPDRLQRELDGQVSPLFKEKYESLDYHTRQIFLDIACFFTEVEKSYPYYMWHARGRDPNTSVDKLQEMSFLKIEEKDEFWMHNQLQLFGRETVEDEGREDPAKRSRLWDYEDVQTALWGQQVTREVQALRVTSNNNRDSKSNCFYGEDFLRLPLLRFLDLRNCDVEGNSEDVLRELVWLDWHGCSEKSQLFAFRMEKLVILDLCSSQVQLNLEDWRTLMRKATHLKVLNAKDCHSISAALEFPNPVPLERLILERSLLVIPTDHLSTYGLEKLVTLNMKGCKQIKSLPQELFSLQELKELFIDRTEITRLEFKEGSLPQLEILSACECKDLVDIDSITFLKNLQKLTLRKCQKLKKLPAVIGELDQLQEMDLSHTLIGELPLSVKNLTCLEVLNMVRTPINGFPEVIEDLKKLKELDFTNCVSMVGVCNIAGLSSLRILRIEGTRTSVPRNIAAFGLHVQFDHGDNELTAP